MRSSKVGLFFRFVPVAIKNGVGRRDGGDVVVGEEEEV